MKACRRVGALAALPSQAEAHPPQGQGDDWGNNTANLVAQLVNDYLG
jgi:hypothetical protein